MTHVSSFFGEAVILIKLIKAIFYLGPLLFAFGFIWPLTMQIISALEWTPPLGLTPFWAAFAVAAVWGAYAQWRGTWLPVR